MCVDLVQLVHDLVWITLSNMNLHIDLCLHLLQSATISRRFGNRFGSDFKLVSVGESIRC